MRSKKWTLYIFLVIRFIYYFIAIRLREIPPYCLEFVQKYIDIERSQEKPDHKRISRGFDDAITHFGKENLG